MVSRYVFIWSTDITCINQKQLQQRCESWSYEYHPIITIRYLGHIGNKNDAVAVLSRAYDLLLLYILRPPWPTPAAPGSLRAAPSQAKSEPVPVILNQIRCPLVIPVLYSNLHISQGRHHHLVTSHCQPRSIFILRPSPALIMSSPTPPNGSRRPSTGARFPTAPSVMTMNGHFASVGEAPTEEQYEHGIQAIDEEKEFKYADHQEIVPSRY
jgi:hypothetical protein